MTSIASECCRSAGIIIFHRFGSRRGPRSYDDFGIVLLDSSLYACYQVKDYHCSTYPPPMSNSIFRYALDDIRRTVFSYTILVYHGLCPFVGTPFL